VSGPAATSGAAAGRGAARHLAACLGAASRRLARGSRRSGASGRGRGGRALRTLSSKAPSVLAHVINSSASIAVAPRLRDTRRGWHAGQRRRPMGRRRTALRVTAQSGHVPRVGQINTQRRSIAARRQSWGWALWKSGSCKEGHKPQLQPEDSLPAGGAQGRVWGGATRGTREKCSRRCPPQDRRP
jgi:hypothetical protein